MTKTTLGLLAFSLISAGCATGVGLGLEGGELGGAAGQVATGGSAAFGGATASGGAPGSGAGSATGGQGSSGPDSGGPEPECSEPTQQIYLLTALEQPYLYAFDATSYGMKQIGQVLCPGYPPLYSMTIARDGTAWVSATSGELFTLDLGTLKCLPKKYDPKASGWYQLQIAFVADAPGSKSETLYAVDVPSGELGTIDTVTFEVTKIGKLTPAINLPRLTGTGDGKLFGMGFTTPIAEVDKSDATLTVLKDVQELSGNGGGLGFAQLEGDLFAFRGVGGKMIRVGRYSPAKNAFVKLVDVPIATEALVAGAAVSTCAPFSPVK